MGRRNYGPIPIGVWDLPTIEDASDGARGVFLSCLGICCYHGRFPRDPRSLSRLIAWPRWDGGLARLDAYLDELEGLGLIDTWVGRDQDLDVWVGHVVGYRGLEGLPENRKYHAPPNPDHPDRSDDASAAFKRPKLVSSGSMEAYSHSTHPLQPPYSQPTDGLQAGYSGSQGSYTGSTPPGQYRVVQDRVSSFQEDRTRARMDALDKAFPPEPPKEPEPRDPLGETLWAPLDEPGQSFCNEYSRRVSLGSWGAGNHNPGLFSPDSGLTELEMYFAGLKAQNEPAYLRAMADFWPAWDAHAGQPDTIPRKLCRAIDEWLIREGLMESVGSRVINRMFGPMAGSPWEDKR